MRSLRLTRILWAGLLAGCTGPFVCTDVGCPDQLIVRFDRAPTGAYRVEAFPDGQAEPRVVECATAAACGGGAVFVDLVAERVTLRVAAQAGTVTREVQPRYEGGYPNGRSCGAACRVATVTLPFPS